MHIPHAHLSARRQVILPRPNDEKGQPQAVLLTVAALPLGWKRRLEAFYPEPAPPTVPVSKNGELAHVPQYHDPAFRAAWRERKELESFFMLWLALKGAPEIQPPPPTCIDNLPALSAFRTSCEGSGLSEGDLGLLFDAILQVSNLDSKEVELRRAGFSSRTMQPTTAP